MMMIASNNAQPNYARRFASSFFSTQPRLRSRNCPSTCTYGPSDRRRKINFAMTTTDTAGTGSGRQVEEEVHAGRGRPRRWALEFGDVDGGGRREIVRPNRCTDPRLQSRVFRPCGRCRRCRPSSSPEAI